MSALMHPGVFLWLWTLTLVGSITAGGHHPVLVFSVLVGSCLVVAGKQTGRMLWRAKFLLLAILFSSLLVTPGELVPAAPWVTYEGIAAAANQLMLLIMVISMVAVLTARAPAGDLMAALLTCFRPLRRFGRADERLATRLILTLQCMQQHVGNAQSGAQPETQPRAQPGAAVAADAASSRVRIVLPEWRTRDYAVLFAGTAFFVLIFP